MPEQTCQLERFWERVAKTDGCWLWTAGKNGDGYGRMYVDGRQHPSHRWIYEQIHGPVDPEWHVDHLCRTPACVRPDHLEAVTEAENIKRGNAAPAMNARKTACKHGHAFSGSNLIVLRGSKGMERRCRECKLKRDREAQRRRRERLRAQL